jgi:hypothetical protein
MRLNLNTLILKNLHYNEEYTRKVLPFIKDEYFNDRCERTIFNEISSFVTDYGNIPTYEALVIQLNEKSISDDEYKETLSLLNELHETVSEVVDLDWLVDKTEVFCQEKSIYNAVRESITILDNKHKDLISSDLKNIVLNGSDLLYLGIHLKSYKELNNSVILYGDFLFLKLRRKWTDIICLILVLK